MNWCLNTFSTKAGCLHLTAFVSCTFSCHVCTCSLMQLMSSACVVSVLIQALFRSEENNQFFNCGVWRISTFSTWRRIESTDVHGHAGTCQPCGAQCNRKRTTPDSCSVSVVMSKVVRAQMLSWKVTRIQEKVENAKFQLMMRLRPQLPAGSNNVRSD